MSLFLINLAVESVRYAIAAGAAYFVFWVWLGERLRARWVHSTLAERSKIAHDVFWSLSTILVFALNGVAIAWGARAGIIRRYEHVSDYGWLWFAASVVLLIVLQDTYFYWTHRAMHHPALFRVVHRVHHASATPSPWSAYAFSPYEAMTHALFVTIIWAILPLHELAVFAFMTFMVTRNVLGHLSIEVFPRAVTSWSTTTTHHAHHHRYPGVNYGLYFTFWDRVMGTNKSS